MAAIEHVSYIMPVFVGIEWVCIMLEACNSMVLCAVRLRPVNVDSRAVEGPRLMPKVLCHGLSVGARNEMVLAHLK